MPHTGGPVAVKRPAAEHSDTVPPADETDHSEPSAPPFESKGSGDETPAPCSTPPRLPRPLRVNWGEIMRHAVEAKDYSIAESISGQ